MDRQVEVIAGDHVLTRTAGAVILVAHRERGKPGPDSRAVIAARALGELVAEATELDPAGPGRLVARQATRWLMREAERISPGEPIEFGILGAADTGGLAIFLHGSVTAVLAGAVTEYYRGSDAAFTVDRVAEPPARAAALFIDDNRRRPPELPERGIGSLIEGIALASGAVVWFEGAPVLSRQALRAVPRRRAEIPPPTAAFDSDREAGSNREVGFNREVGSEHEVGSERQAGRSSGRHRDLDPIALDPNLIPTRTSNRLPAGAVPAIGSTDPVTEGIDAPSPDLHHALTEAAGPSETSGTNPAPKPDPDLQRRLEQTAKANALTVKVLGFKCARAHPSDPRSAFCTVCGMPVDQTQQVAEVIRPPLGMLILDDGMTYMVVADAVVGRDPEHSEAARTGLAPLRIDDNSGGMSRAHAELRLVNWDITLVDRGSTNGTRVRPPGYRDWVRLAPNQPFTLLVGTEIMLGNRVLRLEPVAPPPFG
ncbi:FHA domain-containing protein [Nocardia yunnanensis]|uniref:FHA domain-containing protein n=1 Tax=Nocardia yunnanensis TaxID=2382165 RepID=A0A386ZGH9_9NOCA|nr:FHA domain-containing protein [Nocardia yunnanensis]AYF76638.1 FHA domain-containing protein [Nocardia yunnanensis]